MDMDTHDDRTSPTATRANKKFRPATDFEQRAPGQRRTIPSQGGDTESKRPHVPAPSSPTISYKSDEPEDAEMEDKKILSSILRGVDITEVDSPQRVVDVCHKYQLIKGDSFDLRTGFDLSDPAVQQRVGKRIVETNAELVILSSPCTKFSTLQALNLYSMGRNGCSFCSREGKSCRAH